MSLGSIILNTTLKNTLHQLRLISCWSCGKNNDSLVANLFCSYCKTLQKPESKENYFKIMGVNETYDLDENELANKYKNLQRYLHPDKYGNKSKEEQEISETYSSLVNEAYKTLLEPLARGIYMLKLRGGELPETTEVNEMFLMSIMEKNEEVENAKSEEEIMNLNKENKSVMQQLQKEVSEAFFNGDFKKVTLLLTRMKYYTSIDAQIQNIIRNKGIIR